MKALNKYKYMNGKKLVDLRNAKFRKIGEYYEATNPPETEK
jgi:hypothetical protein